MNPLFICPPPTSLATIAAQACPESFDQIVKLLIQRKQPSGTPTFTATSILLEATWTPLLTAVDDTKVIKTPLIPNIVIPTGEVLKEGGNDNTTINGIPKLSGLGFVACTAQMQNADSATRAALRALASESAIMPGFTNLSAYLVNRFGQIIAFQDGTDVYGIDVYNFVCGDVGSEGFNKPNVANVSWDFAPGWSHGVHIFTPTDFNAMNL